MTSACYFCATPTNADSCPQCQQVQVLQGKYRLLRVLGQGGFGVVYQARDLRFERVYAIKVIMSQSAADQALIQSEADILAKYARQLSFMPEIYDHWTEGNRTYLVMEFIAGKTLGQLIEQHQRINVSEAEQMLKTLLEHVHDLHKVGIIHRDLKPENISRTPNGRLVLLDFGISKQHNATMTAAKALSPYYSSPEQTLGQPTDARSDLYSLGATIYHLATGETAPPALMRLTKRVQVTMPKRIVPQISQPLNKTLLALLELEADHRPASAEAALELLTNPDVRNTTTIPVAAGATTAQRSQRPSTYRMPALDPLPPSKDPFVLGDVLSDVSQTIHKWNDPDYQHDRQVYRVVTGIIGLVMVMAVVIVLGMGSNRQSVSHQRLQEINALLEDSNQPQIAPVSKPAPEPAPVTNPLLLDLEWQDLDQGMRIAFVKQGNPNIVVKEGSLVDISYQMYDSKGVEAGLYAVKSFTVGAEHSSAFVDITEGLEQTLVGRKRYDKFYLELPAELAVSDYPESFVFSDLAADQSMFYLVEIISIR